jgi:hypothetical protein
VIHQLRSIYLNFEILDRWRHWFKRTKIQKSKRYTTSGWNKLTSLTPNNTHARASLRID